MDIVITEDIVREHLLDMGYSAEALSDEILKEFADELKRLYSSDFGERIEEEQFDIEQESDSLQEFQSQQDEYIHQIQGNSQILKSTYRKFDNEEKLLGKLAALDLNILQNSVLEQIQSATQEHEDQEQSDGSIESLSADSSELSDYSISAITSTTSAKSREYKNSGCNHDSPLVIRPLNKKPLKKTDPVSRFHQHQAAWNKDQFLKQRKSREGPSRWGGLVAPAPVKTKRPNLAAMRSNYVVPTTKDRRDVIWEIRNRLSFAG